MTKITLFAQVIQQLPKELIKSLNANWREVAQNYLGHYWLRPEKRRLHLLFQFFHPNVITLLGEM